MKLDYPQLVVFKKTNGDLTAGFLTFDEDWLPVQDRSRSGTPTEQSGLCRAYDFFRRRWLSFYDFNVVQTDGF
jgi:hypothetical protein